jgi:4-hydroxybenzoate polyprenyltransferase
MLTGTSMSVVLKALMQLFRLPNVLMIILIQFLLRYCIVLPFLYADAPDAISPLPDFLILVAVTVFIAIGGYVINDYFDQKTDSINRPEKQVVNRTVSGQTALQIHLILNGIAILLGFYLAWRIHSLTMALVFPFISALLWIYSSRYKRELFWGNFIVAVLSACVILIVWLFEFFWMRLNAMQFVSVLAGIKGVTNVFLAYALFAFLVSMAREIIKDMEDISGDAVVGCKTLPLVYGITVSRYISAGILAVLIILLFWVQLILYRLGLFVVLGYFAVTVQPGAFFVIIKLFQARDKRDFHLLSNFCKMIMLAGILSMVVVFFTY